MNLSQEEKKFIKMVKNEDKDLGLGIPKNHPDNELGTAKQEMKNLMSIGNRLVKKGICQIAQDDRRIRSFCVA